MLPKLEHMRSAHLRSETREVVGRLQGTSDTLFNGSIATVVGRQDGVLEASGVLDVKVDLASLAVLGDGNAGTDGGDIGVVDESHGGLVAGDTVADSALGAASSSVGDTLNGDLKIVSNCVYASQI